MFVRREARGHSGAPVESRVGTPATHVRLAGLPNQVEPRSPRASPKYFRLLVNPEVLKCYCLATFLVFKNCVLPIALGVYIKRIASATNKEERVRLYEYIDLVTGLGTGWGATRLERSYRIFSCPQRPRRRTREWRLRWGQAGRVAGCRTRDSCSGRRRRLWLAAEWTRGAAGGGRSAQRWRGRPIECGTDELGPWT